MLSCNIFLLQYMRSFANIGLREITAYKNTLLWQLFLTALCATMSYLVLDLRAAAWSLVGGLLLLTANAIFGVKIFQYRRVSSAKNILLTAFAGWVMKFCALTVGFLLIFNFMEAVYTVCFFITLVVVNCAHFIMLLSYKENG